MARYRRMKWYPSEDDVELWFLHNYGYLGFDKIVRTGTPTDYQAFKGGKSLNVELKVEASYAGYQISQGHRIDVLICHRKDMDFEGMEIIEIRSLDKESFCQCPQCQQLMAYKKCRMPPKYLMAKKPREKGVLLSVTLPPELDRRLNNYCLKVAKTLGYIPSGIKQKVVRQAIKEWLFNQETVLKTYNLPPLLPPVEAEKLKRRLNLLKARLPDLESS